MHHTITRSSPAVSLAGAALLGLSLFVGSLPEAIAQGTPAQKSADKGAQAAGQTDTVIISKMPERKGPIYSLLKKLFCKNNGAVTGATNSEVWSVPQGQTSRISKRLEALGMTVTKLAEDWNHILKRHQGPMTSAQQDMVDKMKTTPGMVGVQVLRIPDSALTAFAMTNERYNPTVPPELQTPTKEQAPSTVVLPISPDKNITLQRVRYVQRRARLHWHGIVAETGESALLMRWNDGHITGLVGYKGRIYTVASLGGQLHAMVEMDPRQMPPDHAAFKPTADPRADLRPDAPVKTAAAAIPPVVKPLSDAERKALEAKTIVIDLMMLYTKKAPAVTCATRPTCWRWASSRPTRPSATAGSATSACGSCTPRPSTTTSPTASTSITSTAWSTRSARSRTSASCATRRRPTSSA